jgi:hypothetical protein
MLPSSYTYRPFNNKYIPIKYLPTYLLGTYIFTYPLAI